MKIQSHVLSAYSRTAVTPVDGATHVAPGAAPAQGEQGTPAAEVHVSQHARELAARAAFDPAKVEALKAKVQSGQFQVDPHAVARRMVDVMG